MCLPDEEKLHKVTRSKGLDDKMSVLTNKVAKLQHLFILRVLLSVNIKYIYIYIYIILYFKHGRNETVDFLTTNFNAI